MLTSHSLRNFFRLVFKKDLFLPLFLITSGFILRLFQLGKYDLWYDEAFVLFIAGALNSSPGHYLHTELLLFNPPLYSLFLIVWAHIFGLAEWVIRFPSVLASTASILVTYLLAKKMFSKKVALFASLALVLSPFQLWYAQEATHYSLALFLALLGTYFFYVFFFEDKSDALIGYLVFSCLSLYCNHFSILLFFCQLLFIFYFKRMTLKKRIIALTPLLIFMPWAPFFIQAVSCLKKGFWIEPPTIVSLRFTLENFILGYHGSKSLYSFSFFLTFALCLFSFILLLRSRWRDRPMTLCFVMVFAPVFFVYLSSKIGLTIYLDRGFLILTPYFYILLAATLYKIHFALVRRLATIIYVFLLLAGCVNYFQGRMYEPDGSKHHLGVYSKKPFKPLANFLKANFKDNDYLVFTCHAPVFPTGYYLHKRSKEMLRFSYYAYDEDALDTNLQRPFIDAYKDFSFFISKDKAINVLKGKAGRIFLIGCNFARDGGYDNNSQAVKIFFDERLHLAGEWVFDGVRVSLYDKKSG